MTEQQPSNTKAQELFEQGKLAFNNGEYESSVTKLGEACQLLQVSVFLDLESVNFNY